MTWIKPSFLWMMYRCGWGTKPSQETVLAVEITRDGFEWALRHACLSSYVPGVHSDHAAWRRQLKSAPARIQWDPERDLHLGPCRTAPSNSVSPVRPSGATRTSGRSASAT